MRPSCGPCVVPLSFGVRLGSRMVRTSCGVALSFSYLGGLQVHPSVDPGVPEPLPLDELPVGQMHRSVDAVWLKLEGMMASGCWHDLSEPPIIIKSVRSRLVLLAVGVALAVAGLWVTTMPIQINEGNRCGANGCMGVSATVPSVAPGMLLFVVGFVIVVYGLRRSEGE